MRKLSLYGLCALITVAGSCLLYNKQHSFTKIQEINPVKSSEFAESDGPQLAQQQEFERTKDPALGYVPRERLVKAYEYAEQLRAEAKRRHGAIPGIIWTERGPSNIGGRTAAIMVDPNDATHKTVFSAGVDGGLWKTTDITVVNPVWTPINDFFSNMAITTIAYDPSATTTMYFGTGEGWFNLDAVRGDGIWKSTDGGATWAQLASTAANSNFNFVNKIAVDATGNIYAATSSQTCNRGGIFKSTDGGVTWTLVCGTQGGTCGTSNCQAADVAIAADGTLYGSLGIFATGSIWKSTTGNAGTWSQINTGANGFPNTNVLQRISIACAPSSAATVYAITQSSATNGLFNTYKTINAGVSWTTCGLPSWVDQACGAPVSDFTRTQGWYDLSIAVDPANANNVFIGGVDLMKSTNGGTSWAQITNWAGLCGFQQVHADHHIILFQPGSSNNIYFGNDGGIYATTNGTNAVPTITSKNSSYRVTQFYSVAMHPTSGSNYFLCGAQDNGNQQFTVPGMNATTDQTGGDGAFCHIDQLAPAFQFCQYVYNNYYISTNGGATWTSDFFANTGQFINPSDFDNTAKIMYAGSTAGNYFRWNNPEVGGVSTSTMAIAAFGGASVTAVTVSPNVANCVYFGLNNGLVVKVTAANGGAPVGTSISAGLPAGSVSCVCVQKGNENHMLVTYSNYGITHILESTNNGTTWTSDVGNLPDMPVRWAMFNPNNAGLNALIATEVGVWTTTALAGGATNWGPSNGGLANVRTDMLQYRASDGLIAAATHGRGMFTMDGSNSGPLPVQFLSFGGSGTADGNQLIWVTASEINNARFDVQRSEDGEVFSTIGSVKGSGTTSQQHSYAFLDGNINAKMYYYRLKQVDLDGNNHYSNTISINSYNAVLITVFPNPFTDEVTLHFDASQVSHVSLNLYDISGRLVYKYPQTDFNGTDFKVNLAQQHLSRGVYFLNVITDSGNSTHKIVKL